MNKNRQFILDMNFTDIISLFHDSSADRAVVKGA